MSAQELTLSTHHGVHWTVHILKLGDDVSVSRECLLNCYTAVFILKTKKQKKTIKNFWITSVAYSSFWSHIIQRIANEN